MRSKYYSVDKTVSMKKRTFAVDIDGTITENGGGRIHLDALGALRHLTNMGHDVIFVTGRSSVEGFLLSVFGGTTKISVGENGGCITLDSNEHILLGDIEECKNAFQVIKSSIENVKEKPVFPRIQDLYDYSRCFQDQSHHLHHRSPVESWGTVLSVGRIDLEVRAEHTALCGSIL